MNSSRTCIVVWFLRACSFPSVAILSSGSANLLVGKDIVFGFIIEYSSLMNVCPYVIDLFLYEDFWKVILWLVLKIEISCRVMVSWRILVSFGEFFLKIMFLHGEIFEFSKFFFLP
jgi:hypothetical protein